MTRAERNSVLRSAMFTVGGRWLSRLIGLLSTVVLARILAPEDFGIVAMSFMVLGLAASFLDIGVNIALVRNLQATADHYHAAWTLRLLQTMLIATTVAVIAPLAGEYFHDPRVTPVLWLLALNVLIGSFENIGIVDFQKHSRFDREFRYQLINRVFSLVCTVSLAFWLRSYWGLIAAATVSTVFNVCHSYRAHQFRPKLSLAKVRDIFGVSQWVFVQNLGLYFDANLHKMLVGRRDDTATMGAYSLASDLAALPSTELLAPLNRALFPAFVAIKTNLAELKRSFLLVQSLQVLVALPAASFIALLAHDLVPVLLGAQWYSSIPFVRTLAVSAAIGAVQTSAWYVGLTLGRERQMAYLTWAQIAVFSLTLWVLLPQGKALDIAQVRVAVPAAALFAQLWLVSRALGGVRTREFLASVWRPVLGAGACVAFVGLIPTIAGGHLANLLLRASICVTLYPTLVYALWRVAGSPQGAERYLGDKLTPVIGRLLGTSALGR